MSEKVQLILDAARSLGPEQRRELIAALAAIDTRSLDASGHRKQLVDAVKGKYRHVPTSSASFIERKRDEVERESR